MLEIVKAAKTSIIHLRRIPVSTGRMNTVMARDTRFVSCQAVNDVTIARYPRQPHFLPRARVVSKTLMEATQRSAVSDIVLHLYNDGLCFRSNSISSSYWIGSKPRDIRGKTNKLRVVAFR